MAIFTRQFSTMIDAGLPLVQCLNILSEQSGSKNLRDVTGNVARSVEEGATLAESLRRHQRTFDDLYTNMVEVGGRNPRRRPAAPRRLHREGGLAQAEGQVRAHIRAASSAWPSLVIAFMLAFVIPTFASMFKEMGAGSPLPTRIVIALSDFVRGYFWLLGLRVRRRLVRAPLLLPH